MGLIVTDSVVFPKYISLNSGYCVKFKLRVLQFNRASCTTSQGMSDKNLCSFLIRVTRKLSVRCASSLHLDQDYVCALVELLVHEAYVTGLQQLFGRVVLQRLRL